MTNNPNCYNCNVEAETQIFNNLESLVCPNCRYELTWQGMPTKTRVRSSDKKTDAKLPLDTDLNPSFGFWRIEK